MAIAIRSIGTVAAASSGPVTPGLPSGWGPGDLLLAFVASNDAATHTFPAGWTVFDTHKAGTFVNGTLAWRRAQAGDIAPTITGAVDQVNAQIVAFTGVTSSGDPIDLPADAPLYVSANITTLTTNDMTPAVANEMLLFVATVKGNKSISGYSGTNPAFAEAFDWGQAATGGPGGCLAYGLKTDTTAAGARTATLSSATTDKLGWLFGLKPDQGGNPIKMIV